MYFVDFFKKVFKINNIPVLIYLIFNIIISVSMLTIVTNSLLLSILLYLIFSALSLSPVGEFYLRFKTGAKKLSSKEEERLIPLFNEVYSKVLEKNKNISKNIKLFISRADLSPNAFATGRNTICVTKGLLNLTDEDIKGVFAHEFGHLVNKDTDLLSIILIGNLIVNIYIVIVRIIIIIISIFIGDEESSFLVLLLTTLFLNLIIYISGKISLWLISYSGRQQEYDADKFAHEIGFGDELYYALKTLEAYSGEVTKGVFAMLEASHPNTEYRLKKLVKYKKIM
ncbi:M48 family metalloprotease [Oceanivirga salmonicida]|uniref:M48 family metalloprotease n=1 Tax=Oceanivirga salmonicida TaxID=1769291 RepID=UPI000835EB16|nr:M48 family metalloprotease [Oceanivirga salmonicida]